MKGVAALLVSTQQRSLTYRSECQHGIRKPEAPVSQTSSPSASAGLRDVSGWFYRPEWRLAPWAETPRIPTGEVLIFADSSGLATSLTATLPSAGATLVRPGNRFGCTAPGAYTLRPGAPADYAALLAALAEAGRTPDHVLHLWSVDATGDASLNASGDAIEAEMDRGVSSVARLLHAMESSHNARPLRLPVVTRGAQPAAGAPVERPVQAMALALPRAIPEQYPHIRCRTVDLAGSDLSPQGVSRLALDLLHELGLLVASGHPLNIVRRGTQRYELTFEPKRIDADLRGPTLRPCGPCLITGGLGGIGLVLARHLAAAPGAQLVLVSRTGLPPRALWPDVLAANPAPRPGSMAWRIHAVLEMERAGAEVLILAADVAREPEMRRAIAAARARFGSIGGVVHAAGIAVDGALQRHPEGALWAALAPKLQGTLLLARLTCDVPLGFFAMCSSPPRGLGELSSSAANGFLDALASSLRQRGVRAVSITWDAWGEGALSGRAKRAIAAAHESANPWERD